MAAAVGILTSSFNDDARVVVSIFVDSRAPNVRGVWLKNSKTRVKKIQKKTCHAPVSSARGEKASDKCPHFVVQKKSKKVKKKLVRALEI